MVTLPLGTTDWKRTNAQEPAIPVRNRYFEKNPTNLIEGSALLCRPGLKRWQTVGNGPIRGLYSQPGSFEDALFAVSEASLYRIDQDDSQTAIGSGIWGTSLKANVSMAATARIGSTPEMLYIADGAVLWLYMANAYAYGTLTATGAIANGDKIKIDTVYYQWTSGSVDTGTPDGSTGNPWLVALGSTNADALNNMAFALTLEGTAGSTYSTATTVHPTVNYRSYTSTALVVQAISAGSGGNSIATTVETGVSIAWAGATLANGGSDSLTQVEVPDALGIIAVTVIDSYVIAVVAQTTDYKGRFFWIEPGENFIRPLNFATAEQRPDPLHGCRTVGDQLWLLGSNSTEIWYPTGIADTPFARTQGQMFDRGTWEGTDVQVKENLFIVDSTGAVYNLAGGLNRISSPGIEQRIREAMRDQLLYP